MRVFVAFGYNDRDCWIQDQVFPILKCMGFTVVDGKDLVGQPLSSGVGARIQQTDAAVGFFTVREGQKNADYNSHQWVLQEMSHAHAVLKLRYERPRPQRPNTLAKGISAPQRQD